MLSAFVVSHLCFTTSLHQHFSLGWKFQCPRWVWFADTTQHNTTWHDTFMMTSHSSTTHHRWSVTAMLSWCCCRQNVVPAEVMGQVRVSVSSLQFAAALAFDNAAFWCSEVRQVDKQLTDPKGLETMKETQMHLPRSSKSASSFAFSASTSPQSSLLKMWPTSSAACQTNWPCFSAGMSTSSWHFISTLGSTRI